MKLKATCFLINKIRYGDIAQLVELLPYKQNVSGSSPFVLNLILNSSKVEQSAVNRLVVGSNPTWGVRACSSVD